MTKTKSNNKSKKRPVRRLQKKREADNPRAKYSCPPPSVVAVAAAIVTLVSVSTIPLGDCYTSSAARVANAVATTARSVSKTVSIASNNKCSAAALEPSNITNKYSETCFSIAALSLAETADFGAIPNDNLQLNFSTTGQPVF